MRLTWSEHLSIGNEKIDLDHKLLFGLIEGVEHAMEYRDCTVLSKAFNLLVSKLRSHFTNEEYIAETVQFPFAQHKKDQQYFLKEVEYLKDELLCKEGVWCEAAIKHFSGSLRGLLMDHITRKDMLMKPFLQKHPYDLTSVGLNHGFVQRFPDSMGIQQV